MVDERKLSESVGNSAPLVVEILAAEAPVNHLKDKEFTRDER